MTLYVGYSCTHWHNILASTLNTYTLTILANALPMHYYLGYRGLGDIKIFVVRTEKGIIAPGRIKTQTKNSPILFTYSHTTAIYLYGLNGILYTVNL